MLATARRTVLIFKNLRDGYKDQFAAQATKDDVDALADKLATSLAGQLRVRGRELDNIAEVSNIDRARVEDLEARYARDADNLSAYLTQTADRRKAAIDKEALNVA